MFVNKEQKFYVKDCALDTDLEILIPDTYVSNISERFYLYKELNNFTKEEEITDFIERLSDRFGKTPKAIYNVCDALRLRWLAKEIGFERVILKDDKMRAYFPAQADSPYYNSDAFKRALDYLNHHIDSCEMIEKKGKLSIKIKSISDVKQALEVCREIVA